MILTILAYGAIYLGYYFMLLRLANSIRCWYPGIDTLNISLILIGITLSAVMVKVIIRYSNVMTLHFM